MADVFIFFSNIFQKVALMRDEGREDGQHFFHRHTIIRVGDDGPFFKKFEISDRHHFWWKCTDPRVSKLVCFPYISFVCIVGRFSLVWWVDERLSVSCQRDGRTPGGPTVVAIVAAMSHADRNSKTVELGPPSRCLPRNYYRPPVVN